jgi:hypothetical protein
MAAERELAARVKGIWDVLGDFARRHHDHVEADIAFAVIRVMREPEFGRADNALLTPLGHRFHGLFGRGARFDFDKDQGVAAAGDDIDFAERGFPAPRQNW